MHAVAVFVVFVLTHLVLLYAAEEEPRRPLCPPFLCGKLDFLSSPFYNISQQNQCDGAYPVDCTDADNPKIQLQKGGHWYKVLQISQGYSIQIKDTELQNEVKLRGCKSLESFGLPSPSFTNVTSMKTLGLFKCNHSFHNITSPIGFNNRSCGDYNIYYYTNISHPIDNTGFPSFPQQYCSFIQLPASDPTGNPNYFFSFLPADFVLQLSINIDCLPCRHEPHHCLFDLKNKTHYCATKSSPPPTKSSPPPSLSESTGEKRWRTRLKFGLGFGLGVPALFLIIFMFWRCNQRHASSKFLTRSITDPYLNTDLEEGSVYFGVPVFSYTDLQNATNNFDSEKELGDGGFGTVYHGKLKDGREVAVKRLYQHNYKRVEQFKNEVEILTRLRHKNLVSLYGCTSRHSRELLLVYEYIPNGTVADHLHGDRSQPSLPWSIRMSIAIETATALTYLHASDIVHRDVKTNNILLDNNFCVKVADFGLSRLFPTDVTHISTCPQGTPGYVDPEYHQCYQLTSKSDVYSFGVVLIELISSMPAVDITRHRDEINLANLATNKIQKCEFHELIDQSLGFDSDSEVRRMTIAVAELAFRCLQQNKEMRPSMEEVLEALKREVDRPENQEKEFGDLGVTQSVQPPPSPECDELGLLKDARPPLSPISVTQKWPSTRSVTPNDSGKMIKVIFRTRSE